jgi:hypothetical protein
MDNTLLALAAGAIGSVVTLAATGGVRFLTARNEIEANDRLIDELNEDLERWVADDDVRLRRELRDIRAQLAARGMFQSGEYSYLLGVAKERALQAYRDQETRAQREAALIRDRENWMHAFWRQRQKMPRRLLTAPTKVKPVLDAWRLPPSKHLQEGDTPAPVIDPTSRSLDEVIAAVRESTDDYL